MVKPLYGIRKNIDTRHGPPKYIQLMKIITVLIIVAGIMKCLRYPISRNSRTSEFTVCLFLLLSIKSPHTDSMR